MTRDQESFQKEEPPIVSNLPNVTLREAGLEDADAVAEIWRSGWRDGHLGFVPDELVKARTEESFIVRARERVDDTTVAAVDGVVAGFVMVVDDEVEQVYVSALHRGTGVAALLLDEAERQVRARGYPDARSRKNYSGMSPITKASGTKRVVLARYARNRRLGDALFLQAYSALRVSPGARAFYDRQRARGATHYQALRALANRLVGILHGCLRTGTRYDEHRAWHTEHEQAVAA